MASIRWLLDTFGPPPREIYLDWAYQIEAAADSAEAAAASIDAPAATPAPSPGEAHWTSLEVASDGCLRLEGLTASMARRALRELREWLAGAPADFSSPVDAPLEPTRPESEPGAETFGACGRLDQPDLDCERSQCSAIRKRGAAPRATWLAHRRFRLTAAGVLLAAVAMLVVGVAFDEAPQPSIVNEPASSSAHSDDTQRASFDLHGDSAVDSADEGAVEAADGDFLAARDNEALEGGWITSAELTAGALETPSAPREAAIASSAPASLGFSLAPSLSVEPSEVAASPPAASPDLIEVPRGPPVASAAERDARAAGAKPLPPLPVDDVMSQVASAVAEAELHSGGDSGPAASSEHRTDATPPENVSPSAQDWTHQPPLMLTRDASFLRSPLPRGFSRRPREPYWTARIELAEEFSCESAVLQTVDARTGAQWRIYDKDARSPRACILVSVRRRGGRDVGLEWSLRGSAEDLPNLRLPVARKWLDTLAAQLKVTAASLRAVADSPAQQVPRELRTLVQNQRQLARQQLVVADRLLTLLAEVDRLASLLDDELLCHAELRESDGGPLLMAYGRCEPETAEADVEQPPAD